MTQFLANFSDSFLLALLIWPFLAALLTLPLLLLQYRRYNKLVGRQVVYTYGFVLYALGLATFTLYPMPDDPVVFCAEHHVGAQLLPLTLIEDIISEGVPAALQVVMNILFFLPLGIFARRFFQWRFGTLVLVAIAGSLTIETAQLTGVFGLYPCSYRLFDVDDIIVNTLGAIIGYGIARLIPQRSPERADKGATVTNPGFIRRLVTFVTDMAVVHLVLMLLVIALQLLTGQVLSQATSNYLQLGLLALSQYIMPLLARGQTLAGMLTRVSLDDIARTPLRRMAFYLVRFLFVVLVVFLPPGWNLLLALVTAATWLLRRRLPYQIGL